MAAHQSRRFSNKHYAASTAATRNKTEDGAAATFSLCDVCFDKDVTKRGTATVDGLSMKEIVLLISDLLKKDETRSGDIHCMCDRCLGINFRSHKMRCRRRRSKSGLGSTKVEGNMAAFKNYYRKMKNIGGDSSTKDRTNDEIIRKMSKNFGHLKDSTSIVKDEKRSQKSETILSKS